MAAIESLQKASTNKYFLNIVYWRNADMALAFNVTAHSNGWE